MGGKLPNMGQTEARIQKRGRVLGLGVAETLAECSSLLFGGLRVCVCVCVGVGDIKVNMLIQGGFT